MDVRTPASKTKIAVGFAMIVLGCMFAFAAPVYAVWNGQPYASNATLSPECGPTQSNCTVVPFAAAGANTDITSLGGLTTPLLASQGGTGLAVNLPAGALLYGNGTSAVTILVSGSNGQVLTVDAAGNPSWVTPVDTLPMNKLTGALATNSIDNAGFTQTFSWNTLGSNDGLALASSDLTATGRLLAVDSASTATVANGIVGYNFSGAHTGVGMQVTDATQTGSAVAVNANALTTGSGLAVSTTAATLAAGNLVSFTQTSTTSNGATLNLGSSGLGLALRISSGALALNKGSDVTTTGTINNAALNVSGTNSSYIRFAGVGAQTLTGIAGGVDGKYLIITNAGANAMTVANQNTGSTAANRITTGTGSDLSIAAGGSTSFIYDSGASLWRVIGTTTGGQDAIAVQRFTSSGFYTPTPGYKYVEIEGVGGGAGTFTGGSSGGNKIMVIGAGGGGAYGAIQCTAPQLGGPISVTIGSGGAGNPGGPTSFGSFMTIPGGNLAAVDVNTGGMSVDTASPAALPTTNTCYRTGEAPGTTGTPGYGIWNPDSTDVAVIMVGGGGDSRFGTGGKAKGARTCSGGTGGGINPAGPTGFGAGSGGAATCGSSGFSTSLGTGSSGILIITEHF